MVRKPQQPDEKLLVSLAEYQVLSARQLTVLHDRNGNALRRRLRQLCAEGLIRFITRTPDGRPGRPDKIDSLVKTPVSAVTQNRPRIIT